MSEQQEECRTSCSSALPHWTPTRTAGRPINATHIPPYPLLPCPAPPLRPCFVQPAPRPAGCPHCAAAAHLRALPAGGAGRRGGLVGSGRRVPHRQPRPAGGDLGTPGCRRRCAVLVVTPAELLEASRVPCGPCVQCVPCVRVSVGIGEHWVRGCTRGGDSRWLGARDV